MPPNVHLLFGPMLIGAFLNMILYGVLMAQLVSYYRKYKKDPLYIKSLVLYLLVTETLNTGFTIGLIYEPLILRFGLQDAVDYFPSMLVTEPFMTVAISTPIQLFIAWRIKRLTNSCILPIIITALAFCSLAGGIWTTVGLSILKVLPKKKELRIPALIWLFSAALDDIFITAALTWNLYKRRTGHPQTDAVINQIITLTIQTGLLTAIVALGDVTFYLASPNTSLNFIWDLALTKLYSNSLLSTLNARASWNNRLGRQRNALFDNMTPILPSSQTDTRPQASGKLRLSGSENPTPVMILNGIEGMEGIEVTTVVERSVDPVFVPPLRQ